MGKQSEQKIRRALSLFAVSFMLFGCPEKNPTPPVDSAKLADEIFSHANEPLRPSSEIESTNTGTQITQFSLNFVNLLIQGEYEAARAFIGPSHRERYPVEKLQSNFQNILSQTGKNPKTVENSLIIDKTLITTERKGVADVYVSVKGDDGLKAMYVSLCGDSQGLQVCHIGWGTEDSGEA